MSFFLLIKFGHGCASIIGYHVCVMPCTGCHDDVVKIVELACKHNVCLIPYGGEHSTQNTS